MANIAPPYLITANGVFDFRSFSGWKHFISLKGTWGGGTAVLSAHDEAKNDGSYSDIIGASWTADVEEELGAATSLLRLTLTGATDPELSFHFISASYR